MSTLGSYGERIDGRLLPYVACDGTMGPIEITAHGDSERRYLNFDNTKTRCAYCQQRNDADSNACEYCGAPLE